MAAPALTLPPFECEATLLPKPANLSNFFGGLAAYPEKLKALAVTTDIDDAEEYFKIAEDIQAQLDSIRPLLDKYDPKNVKFRSPEKEWDIMMNRLTTEYGMYVQTEILALIKTLVPIDFNITVMGITFDIVEVFTDPSSIKESIKEEADRLYEMLPDIYKNYEKFETKELKADAVWNYIRTEMKKKMNLLMHGGFGSLISTFQEIWDTLGLPALPALQELDVEQLIESTMESIETQIKNAPQDAKEALQKEAMTQLESISIAGFSLIDLLGGEIENNLQIDDYDKERLKEKARQFAEDWETYLLKEWMQTVTGFFSAIGLGALTEWTSFNFCQFLTLIGFNPITITLPTSVSTVAASAGVSLPTLPVVNDTSGE
jgi:hypothetical protein|tara:strand:+ start:295 stop:1419 length:1125 start_codon:yes stop_codon:yes gene_type:complete